MTVLMALHAVSVLAGPFGIVSHVPSPIVLSEIALLPQSWPEAGEPSYLLGDSLALSKIAFEVAVQANKVTPITLPAIGSMVLLGAFS